MRILAGFLFSIFFVVSTYGQEKYSATVKLSVGGAESLKSQIQSYVARELRSLGDVTIVDERPNWVLRIMTFESQSVRGQSLGYTYSYVITSGVQTTYLDGYAKCDANTKEALRTVLTDAEKFQAFRIGTAGQGDLQNIAKKIVAEFDVGFLELDRKEWQKVFNSPKP